MRYWVLLLLGACRHAPAARVVPEGGFLGRLGGSDIQLAGSAVYAECQDQYHVFLLTPTAPKSSITIHPMGSRLQGEHPVRPGKALEQSREAAVSDSLPGPFHVAVVLAPDTQLHADSGRVALFTSPDGHVRGTLDVWLGKQPLHSSFVARRDRTLEPGLRDGSGCAH